VFICSTGATLDGGEPKILLLMERRDGLTAIINIWRCGAERKKIKITYKTKT
jgi:hypothetical protein